MNISNFLDGKIRPKTLVLMVGVGGGGSMPASPTGLGWSADQSAMNVVIPLKDRGSTEDN
jgi:hypothetical protein